METKKLTLIHSKEIYLISIKNNFFKECKWKWKRIRILKFLIYYIKKILFLKKLKAFEN